jgi:hypothetical protein
MMTNNPELMDFILKNEGETFNAKEAILCMAGCAAWVIV